jgi:release factor glutamine methyltransferase
MTVRQAVVNGVKRLETNVETPFLDAVVLLASAAGWSKERVLASYPDDISGKIEDSFEQMLCLRMEGRPVSYIRGKKEFYSLEFLVGPGVLVPRPETEILVDAVVDLVVENPAISTVHDTCTGSGCVGISIKHKIPTLNVSVSDISPEALSYFKSNCETLLGEELPNIESDLLTSVTGAFDVITANPPYLTSETYDAMVRNRWPEPALALDGGPDGLEAYRKLIPMSVPHLNPGGVLLLEADPSQFMAIEKMLVQNGFHTTIIYRDLAGRERAIRGSLGTGSTWKI